MAATHSDDLTQSGGWVSNAASRAVRFARNVTQNLFHSPEHRERSRLIASHTCVYRALSGGPHCEPTFSNPQDVRERAPSCAPVSARPDGEVNRSVRCARAVSPNRGRGYSWCPMVRGRRSFQRTRNAEFVQKSCNADEVSGLRQVTLCVHLFRCPTVPGYAQQILPPVH